MLVFVRSVSMLLHTIRWSHMKKGSTKTEFLLETAGGVTNEKK